MANNTYEISQSELIIKWLNNISKKAIGCVFFATMTKNNYTCFFDDKKMNLNVLFKICSKMPIKENKKQ